MRVVALNPNRVPVDGVSAGTENAGIPVLRRMLRVYPTVWVWKKTGIQVTWYDWTHSQFSIFRNSEFSDLFGSSMSFLDFGCQYLACRRDGHDSILLHDLLETFGVGYVRLQTERT